jgi:ubiquinone/menaquinone biosynthesis C-methylase UbiE
MQKEILLGKRRDYREIYARDWRMYDSRRIYHVEARLLEELQGVLSSTRMLDLGVGAGRTTWIFAPLVKDYVGIDVVPEMIQRCVEVYGQTDKQKFLVADATDLTQFRDSSFDLVLFSYNGIDNLSREGRLDCLREVFRVLTPGGLFFYSSHSLTIFPHTPQRMKVSGRNLVRWAKTWWHSWQERARFRRLYAQVLSPETQKRGWVILSDGSHDGQMELYYCYPWAEKECLENLGFRLEKVLTNRGTLVSIPGKPETTWFNYYFCRRPH